MTKLYIDVETYSDVDIIKAGHQRYARDPSTRLLLLAWALDDSPVKVVDVAHGETIPDHLMAMFADSAVEKWAHNAAFERAILEFVAGIPCPPEQWRCTMVHASSLGLPSSLGKLALEILKDQHKLDPGKDLLRMFCMPEGGGPGNPLNEPRWPEFVEYNRVDVEVLRSIELKLRVFPVPEPEWRLWALDQHIHDRGLPIDMPFLRAAAALGESHKATVMGESRETTGLDNPNSRTQLLQWLKDSGVDVPNLQAGTVDALLERKELPAPVRDALEQRQQLSMSSLAKYGTLLEAVAADERLRGVFQFCGASTGRWASRLFNAQNLPRGILKEHDLVPARDYVLRNDTQMIQMLWGDVSGVLSSLVRSAIHAPKNHQLVVADYAS
ncbi:MAG: DNA polymerase, partial [Pseudomonadota bacterium]